MILIFLFQSQSVPLEPIIIVGPIFLELFLEEYGNICELGTYTFISSSDLVQVPFKVGNFSLSTCQVHHVESSFACILKSDTFKVVYSGDTRPSDKLIQAGLDCDLLIHEGTFDNGSTADAVKKMHSTWAEAIYVAAQ